MRGKAISLGCLAAAIVALAGCYHDKYHVKVKHPEDFVIPPNAPQFDQPPEADYKRPMEKKKDKNGAMMGSPGMTGSGQGGGQGYYR